MSADALFWAGLATAVSVGLALCLMALQKRRADLTAAQQMLTAQATETAVAHERNAQLQAELSLYNKHWRRCRQTSARKRPPSPNAKPTIKIKLNGQSPLALHSKQS
jgi:hypothetical protein